MTDSRWAALAREHWIERRNARLTNGARVSPNHIGTLGEADVLALTEKFEEVERQVLERVKEELLEQDQDVRGGCECDHLTADCCMRVGEPCLTCYIAVRFKAQEAPDAEV